MTLKTIADDGLHYSHLKLIGLSGVKYLYAVNNEREPTSRMMLGTLVHFLLFGARPGSKRLVKYEGKRQGNAWKDFEAANEDAEILTASEWVQADEIAEAVRQDPVAQRRLDGARFEVPLVWEEAGIKCSTSGIDIVCAGAIGDLKTTPNVHPQTWERLAFRMGYAQQLAFYRRGCMANGIDVSKGMFVLGVETAPEHEVVDLEMTEGLIDMADRSISLWMERLRVLRESIPEPKTIKDWPGYSQSSIPWDVPAWARVTEEEGDDEEAA